MALPSCGSGGDDGEGGGPGGPLIPSGNVSYDIVYVRIPRKGEQSVKWPEVRDPFHVEPHTDLVLRHPDGTEEVLVNAKEGAVLDPYISYDGLSVYYSYFPNVTEGGLNHQRRGAPTQGCDIYRMDLSTRNVTRLTHQEWTPNTAIKSWSSDPHKPVPAGTSYPGFGVFNLGACPLPGGKIIFTSSRNCFRPTKGMTFPNLQLFVMDHDGKNVELVGHLNLGSAMHPTVLKDGRVMFSSYESQGIRDERNWGLWGIKPDGRTWEPLMSSFVLTGTFHFQTQISNGDIVVEQYYNQNTRGMGTLLAFPPSPPANKPPFGPPNPGNAGWANIRTGVHPNGKPLFTGYPFAPQGLRGLTPFAEWKDNSASKDPGSGKFLGKVGHPSATPNNALLVTWSSGPVTSLARPSNKPEADAGIYLIADARTPSERPTNMFLIKNDPRYNEIQPRAVVSYMEVHGVAEPKEIPWLPNDGTVHPALPKGTPFGLVGTSSFYKRDVTPGRGLKNFNGLDPFNSSVNRSSPNWQEQGAVAGLFSNEDIYAVRILTMEPTSNIGYGPSNNFLAKNFSNYANERLRILGEIPLRKFDAKGNPILDPESNPDTSFLAKIPADVPFTFQTLDKDGLVLDMSQTWHQVRPGEVRNDCGGCHAHSKMGLPFEGTAASKAGYKLWDLTTPVKPYISKDALGKPTIKTVKAHSINVEYWRDIRPILQRSCVPCHNANKADAGLRLDDTAISGGFEMTYHRLANDPSAKYGIKPIAGNKTWRNFNASRYVRMFQSRRSLLIWKIFGRRLDGWKNSDHPSASIPGDPKSLPIGASANDADIDYTGTIMPPPDALVVKLNADEKMMFARWVDLGCPTDNADPGRKAAGWFLDGLRPTLTVQSPAPGNLPGPLTEIRIGAFDYYTDVAPGSLSVKADFAINGKKPQAELGSLFTSSNGIYTLSLSPMVSGITGTIDISVKDKAGNITKVSRTFRN
jgi:Hydrazine synthase alpha subunit middle domain